MKIPCVECKSDIEIDPENITTDEHNEATLHCLNCGEVVHWDKTPWDNEQQTKIPGVVD